MNDKLNQVSCLHMSDEMGLGKGYGMPSSHSQFMGFVAVYAALWFRKQRMKSDFDKSFDIRPLLVPLISVAVCLSRTHLAYHTIEQVLVGCGVGSVFGAIWFAGFSVFQRSPLYIWVLDHPICKHFYLKDSVEANVLRSEWQRWHEQRQVKKRKAT